MPRISHTNGNGQSTVVIDRAAWPAPFATDADAIATVAPFATFADADGTRMRVRISAATRKWMAAARADGVPADAIDRMIAAATIAARDMGHPTRAGAAIDRVWDHHIAAAATATGDAATMRTAMRYRAAVR